MTSFRVFLSPRHDIFCVGLIYTHTRAHTRTHTCTPALHTASYLYFPSGPTGRHGLAKAVFPASCRLSGPTRFLPQLVYWVSNKVCSIYSVCILPREVATDELHFTCVQALRSLWEYSSLFFIYLWLNAFLFFHPNSLAQVSWYCYLYIVIYSILHVELIYASQGKHSP